MNKTTIKKGAAILAVVTVGAFVFNSIANRVKAVDKARTVICAGV